MWRPWDTESEEEQQWDKSESEVIPVLASDSDDSIIFVAKKHSPVIEQPWIIWRARALPTFSSLVSDTSSSLGEYWLINIINTIFVTWQAGMNMNCTNLYITVYYCFK